jgi:diguanylate cyclase (GGDEF)-like protein/PAS domain S-box-containing protein
MAETGQPVVEDVEDVAQDYEALIQFLYLAPVGLVQTSLEGEIAMINPISAQLLMPLSRDGGLSNLFIALESVAPDLRHRVESFTLSYGMVCEGLQIQVSAGVRDKVDARVLSLTLLKLNSERLMAVLSDVTQQVKRDRLLKQSEAWINAILSNVTDYALVSLDSRGHIEDWNPSVGRVTGFAREAVVGKPYSVFYPADATTPDRVQDRLRDADDNGWSLDEGWRLRADGTRFWGSALIAPLQERSRPQDAVVLALDNPGDPKYCLVIRDITDKRDASEAQRKAMSCDHLTGIANRRAFFQAAELELERHRRLPRDLCLILFDVDHFKNVNDTHGHPAGDAVLRDLGAVLAATFRQIDVVARVGGEEFAVLLPSTDIVQAIAVANRLRLAVQARPVMVDGVPIRYTLSGGVATMDSSVQGLDGLMRAADSALYAAKAQGRNCVVADTPA